MNPSLPSETHGLRSPLSTPHFSVLYSNTDMVVVDKPPDVPMDGEGYPLTVEMWATQYLTKRGKLESSNDVCSKEGRKKQIKFVHQLDYATSGVLCLAFTKDMAARLAHCFEMRTTRKWYIALLDGHIPFLRNESCTAWLASLRHSLGSVSHHSKAIELLCDTYPGAGMVGGSGVSLNSLHSICDPVGTEEEGIRVHRYGDVQCAHDQGSVQLAPQDVARYIEINLPVGYDPSDVKNFRMAIDGVDSRPSTTHLRVLERGVRRHPVTQNDVPVTLVLLMPQSGRRHQLRVHCHALGFPVLGDAVYAHDAVPHTLEETSTASGWTRMYLHAWRLRLPGIVEPAKGEKERVAAKKRRRRETLQLEDARDAAAQIKEWTEFTAAIPPFFLTADASHGGPVRLPR